MLRRYFLAKFHFDTAENEPAKNLQNFAKLKFAKIANFERSSAALLGRVAGGRGDGRGARGGSRAPCGGARGARPAVRTFILGRFLFSPFQEQISYNLPAKFLRYHVSKSFRFIIVQIVRNGFLLSLL